MAVGAFTWYENGLLNCLKQNIDFLNNTIKAALLLSTYTPSASTHDALDDVSANECADADYARQTLGGKALTTASGFNKFDANDVSFGNPVTITAKYLVLFKDSGVASTSYLMGYIDLKTEGGSVSSTASEFQLIWDSNGVTRIAV